MGSYRVMKVNFISFKRVGISPLAPCKTGLGVDHFYHYIYPIMDNNKMPSITFIKILFDFKITER